MVDIGEEFLDVAFENMAGAGVVLGNFAEEISETIHGFMSAFVYPAGV